MYFFLYNGAKKEEKTPCFGLFPHRYYKDNTFSREMQIELTFRNSLRNVKRRLLHTWGFVMYYITRRCSGVVMERRKSTPDASSSVLVACVCPLSAPSSFLLLWLEYLPILLGICFKVLQKLWPCVRPLVFLFYLCRIQAQVCLRGVRRHCFPHVDGQADIPVG